MTIADDPLPTALGAGLPSAPPGSPDPRMGVPPALPARTLRPPPFVPAVAAAPVAPVTPAVAAAPVAPVAPVAPTAPPAPVVPVTSTAPVAPVTPVASVAPVAPGGPVVPVVLEATVTGATLVSPPVRRLGHRPELDGLRGLGLLIVVLHHAGLLMWTDHPWWFLPGGQVGLDVFFALSGFLITALLLGEHGRTGGIAIGSFLWRRALRLLPALVAFMGGLLAISLVGERYDPAHVLSSAGWVLTFTTNLVVDRTIVEVGHTWSMGVEAHFYLVWCLVAAVATARARRPHVVLAWIAGTGVVACAVARTVAYGDGGTLRGFDMYVDTLYRIDAPLVGALAGIAWTSGWLDRVPERVARGAGAVAMGVLALATVKTTPLTPGLFRGLFTVVAAAGAVVVLACLRSGPSRLRRFLSLRAFTLGGTISYSVYLWHLPAIMWLERNVPDWPLAGRMVTAVAATLVIGALSYRFVERPFLQRKARSEGRSPLVAP